MDKPSMLAFGPQEPCPNTSTMQRLRHVLQDDPALLDMQQCIQDLPVSWNVLVEQDERLGALPGAANVAALKSWLLDSNSHEKADATANQITMPLTVIMHLVQYRQYLQQFSQTTYSSIMQNVTHGGVQGFCTGLISAHAVATMKSAKDFGACSSSAIRLALCIGAHVDLESLKNGQQVVSAIVRWSGDDGGKQVEATLARYTDAYISVVSDVSSVTVTANTSDMAAITTTLAGCGMSVKMLALTGSYHSSRNEHIAAQVRSSMGLDGNCYSLPGLLAPVRSNSTGDVLPESNAIGCIIEDILCKRSDWYNNMSRAVEPISSWPEARTTIVAFGTVEYMPSFIKSSFMVAPRRFLKEEGSFSSPITAAGEDTLHYPDHAVAVVGLACRFPGADNLDQFWDLLESGRSMHERMPADRFKTSDLRRSHDGAPFWGNFLKEVDAFDHQFFKKSSREAASMDPQQRLLLQCAYTAMESAGHFGPWPEQRARDVGVYIGACSNDYNDNVASHNPTAYSTLGTLKAFLTGRISHYFDWTGPSIVYDTACSSSAVAIDATCKAIASGECSQALAGGVSLYTSPNFYQNLDAASFLSQTGPCKPFDASADGYCRGEGVGLVVLKSLKSALADGDDIRCVIASTGVNQNRNCTGITVPHGGSQAELYQKVVSKSGFDASEVSYVEAHGTGTPVGDPIEFESITSVFAKHGSSRQSALSIASVKGSIGHLEAAAGVASLIKVCLMFQHANVPPQANFSDTNPKLANGISTQVNIPTTIRPWTAPRKIACINNYGAAGSNAAMIVAQAPVQTSSTKLHRLPHGVSYPIVISGDGVDALQANCQAIKTFAGRHQDRTQASFIPSLANALGSSQNRALSHQVVAVLPASGDIEPALSKALAAPIQSQQSKPVVLCFGGQVKSCIGLDRGMFESCLLLQSHLRQCDDIVRGLGHPSLFPSIFQTEPIEDIVQLHAMLFALQYSSAKAWLNCGLQVDAVIGHSFGQLTALTVAGGLSLGDGITLVCGRARLIKELWGPNSGDMIAIEASAQSVQKLVAAVEAEGATLEIACYNGRSSHVVVGTASSIDALEAKLPGTGFKCRRLPVTHGFHSVFTEPLLPQLRELAATVSFRTPSIPLETCTKDVSWTNATPSLIAQHTREPVFFVNAVERLSRRLGPCTWVEASTGASAPAMVKRALGDSSSHTFIHVPLGSDSALSLLSTATADLSRQNHSVRFWLTHPIQRPAYMTLNLPGHQFRGTKHWLEWKDSATTAPITRQSEFPAAQQKHELLTFQRKDQSTATFTIDPISEEFKILVEGHAVLGQPLCPAPLYTALALQAVSILAARIDNQAPEVQDLRINSPLGLDTSREIKLIVGNIDKTDRWPFTVQSSAGIGNTRSHAQGVLTFSASQGSLGSKLATFERLTGFNRIQALLEQPEAEVLKGRTTVYKAFSKAVTYAAYYKGVQAVYSHQQDACGLITVPKDEDRIKNPKLGIPVLVDNFFQIAGLHINILSELPDHQIFVCTQTERLIYGAGLCASPGSKFAVYATASRTDKEAIYDIVVFDAVTRSAVFVAVGAHFHRVAVAGLRKALEGVNQVAPQIAPGNAVEQNDSSLCPESLDQPVLTALQTSSPAPPATRRSSVPSVLVQPAVPSVNFFSKVSSLLNKVSDIPVASIRPESSLDDLGIDSLMVMEVQSEVQSQFNINIPTNDWPSLDTPGRLAEYLSQQIPGATPVTVNIRSPAVDQDSSDKTSENGSVTSSSEIDSSYPGTGATTPGVFETNEPEELVTPPKSTASIGSRAQRSFLEVQGTYDSFAAQEGFSGFWSKVYPTQKRLTLAYVVEAFAQLGCNLSSIVSGQVLPTITYLPEHASLVQQLYKILEDADLISKKHGIFCRSEVSMDPTPASEILDHIIAAFPRLTDEHRLLAVTGSRLGDCLAGKADPLRPLFMDKQNKNLLENVYTNGPMYKAITRLLGVYLLSTFSQSDVTQPIRILEIGGGTGGTTKHIISLLESQGLDFEYIFSDLSRGLVTNAEKKFASHQNMRFITMDVESPPSTEHLAKYDLILSTNCIHATKDLKRTGQHMQQMLKPGGFVCLVEFTRNIFWFDLVFGLLDGWWLFEDGREHVLADEQFWDRSLRTAGFGEVKWTGGDSEESQTLRIITAFKSSSMSAIPAPVRATTTQHRAVEASWRYRSHGRHLPPEGMQQCW
ncbi:Non-reducing polyketide synthase pkbA [Fulvia fulva]|uniref:Non-reducing polyketide synthase pkbA n=1 Tax=Passalora fulva TaxID=5499 RepID=A0A9Q8PKR1_PASFU|nr:Non-reducing polyketide synthase pkbA [Fulvia fulva]KAK4611258.1 Non-reducing polyketide synthase pkbA [Fulvia fulva]UJO24230.1 Non-reducing polyketide synthase pkbA [Fulvia fulva]